MTNRASILDSTWKIFLDGVEVPHQGFSVVFGADMLSRATISLEPDIRLADIRPQTVVAIFARNQFPDGAVDYTSGSATATADFLDNYFLYWEGLVAGFRHEKSYDTRAFIIDCESMFDVWRRARAFAFQIGSLRYSHIVSGATLAMIAPANSSSDTFTLASLGTYFSSDEDTPAFSTRVLRTVATIAAHSAVLRLQTVRYNLLHKVAEIPNNIFETLLAPVALNIFDVAKQLIPEQASAFDVVSHLLSYGFYNTIHIPIPTARAHKQDSLIKPWQPIDSTYAFSAKFARNELLFVPHTYFALPPPCNLIFPDIIQSMSVSRSFYNEPTRSILIDTAFSKNEFRLHIAPNTLVSRISGDAGGTARLRSIDVFGILIGAIETQQQQQQTAASRPPSPYANPIAGVSGTSSSTISLINSLTDLEIEKGIVPDILNLQFEALAAYAASAQAPEIEQDEASKSARIRLYNDFITQILNYKHRLAQTDRELTVIINGHRYLTPGFTAVVYDKDVSYIGYVSNAQLSVNPVGYETTNVTLTHVRPLTLPSAEFIKNLNTEIASIILNTEMLSAERDAAYEALAARLMEDSGIPIPPFFLSESMSSAKKLDELYGRLLGCKPLYTSNYHNNTLGTPFDNIPSVLSAALFYLEGLYTLMNVYDPAKIPSRLSAADRAIDTLFTPASTTAWIDSFNSNDTLGASTVEWTNRTFLHRDGISGSVYLNQSGLILEQELSNGAVREQFLVMTPVTDAAGWDDSVLSKLVQEVVNNDIPEISDRRAKASTFLKTSARQANILAFSKDHFGAKAFNGT